MRGRLCRLRAVQHPRDGWLDGLEHRPSPHEDGREPGEQVTVAVIHYISLPAGCFRGDAVDRLFLGRLDAAACRRPGLEGLAGLRVSAHFFIRRSGRTIQYVDVFRRAWHAGLSNFRGRDAVNGFSVGIELEGTGVVPFTNRQYAALERLLRRLAGRLPLRFVTGHEFIAPGRKADPGPRFDWRRLSARLPRGLETAIAPEDCDRVMLARRTAALAGVRNGSLA